jgi:hypothetical protein
VAEIMTSIGAAALDGVSVSAAAFGAMVGMATPITAAVQASRARSAVAATATATPSDR